MENEIQKIACVGCQSLDKKFFGKKNGYSIYKCGKCTMLSLYEKPKASAAVYDSEYFSGGAKGFGYVNYDEDKEPMRESFKKYLQLIEKHSGKKGKLVDVGAATGFFLVLAQEAGFEVSGVEISDFAASIAREKGLNVITGTLDSLSTHPKESVDAMTLLDVIEHMPDPERDLRIAHTLLTHGGVLVANTPNSGSLYARMMGMKWHLVVPPEHIHYFNKKGIVELFDRVGFDVIVVTQIGKKFTLEYVFSMLFTWLRMNIFQKIATRLQGTRIGKFSFPINFRDNMFVIVKKR